MLMPPEMAAAIRSPASGLPPRAIRGRLRRHAAGSRTARPAAEGFIADDGWLRMFEDEGGAF